MARIWICSALGCAAALAVMAAGGLEPLERPLLDLRMRLVQQPADPQPVLIEIDPRSIHEVGRWPWPRSLHALLLDRLTAAGVGEVYLDIDFSLPSTEAEDAPLERALARREGRTTLAAFRQWSEAAGAYVDAGPLPRFARHARLSSSNLVPAPDGLIRVVRERYPWRGGTLPGFAAAIAGAHRLGAGGDGEGGDGAGDDRRFYIDYGISLDNLTRLSFVDVARGDVDPALLRGRPVIVGATAIALSDMLAVPNHRVLPGVVVQMLAAQSLMLDRALQRLPLWSYLLSLPAFVMLLAALVRRRGAVAFCGVFLGGNALVCAAALGLQAATPVLLDVMPFMVASFLAAAGAFLLRFHKVARSLVVETLSRLRAEKLMGTVAQNAFDALAVADESGHLRFANSAASRMFGLSAAEAEGRSLADFLTRPDVLGERELMDSLQRLAAAGRPRRLVCRRHNGELFYADLAVSRLIDGDRRLFVLVVRDIDRRVKAERRLLARERELRRAKGEAELASQSKTEFLHNMSHELKTPLNAIIGFAEMMEQQLLGPLGSDGYVGYATDIRQSGERLFHTVTDVLEFSRLEAGEGGLQEAEFDLVGLCGQLAEHLEARAGESGHLVEVYLPPAEARYFGDERLIKLALNHVLSNALKFTPTGGKIVFSLHLDDDGPVRIVVEDNGTGIAAEEIEGCFEAFRQADIGLQRSHEGSGLGLTLARRLVELHQGEIRLQSSRGEDAAGSGSGTRVAIILPAARRRSVLSRRLA